MPTNGVHHPDDTQPHHWPKDVGIHAIEVHFPPYFVDQSELEAFDGVSAGKYTVGLGQMAMGFTGDQEDVNSMSLTVVEKLLEKQKVEAEDVGWLGVGTETILDKSKSIKTVLMSIFANKGNTDVEGVDFKNACYGGTAALFSAIDWVESSAWDGRLALVVAVDSAVYAKGPARPTGGAGAVAMLIGPNAPLVMQRGTRASHVDHAFDFYKPDMTSEYPTVDGHLSIRCYFTALDSCYRKFKAKWQKTQKAGVNNNALHHDVHPIPSSPTLDSFDAFIFHTPFSKLVQKSLGRLFYADFKESIQSQPNEPNEAGEPIGIHGKFEALKDFAKLTFEESLFDKDLEKALVKTSKGTFEAKTEPSLFLAKRVGNMYTPSVYGGLVSFLLGHSPADLSGKQIIMFSYGSGLASSMYCLRVTSDASPGSSLDKLLRGVSDVTDRLQARSKMSPSDFDAILSRREETHLQAPYIPLMPSSDLTNGTYYLKEIDGKRRRIYERVS